MSFRYCSSLIVLILGLALPGYLVGQCDPDGVWLERQSYTSSNGLLLGQTGCVKQAKAITPLEVSNDTLRFINGVTIGYVLTWNGTIWVPAATDRQTISAGDGAGSDKTIVLSDGGGAVVLRPGSNVTLSRTVDTITIGATPGAGVTDLTYSGTSSPVTLNSSTGTDVTITAGSGVSLSATGTDLTITANDPALTNEGSLTVGAGGANTSTIISNTSGSTPVTVSGSNTVLVTESGSTITLQADTSLIATVNDINVARNRDDSTFARLPGQLYHTKRITSNAWRGGTTLFQGKGGSSSDTSGIIIISKDHTSTKPGIWFDGDNEIIFEVEKDSRGDSISDFGLYRGWFDDFSNAGDNQVMQFGWNTSPGGGRKNTTRASMAIHWEEKYNTGVGVQPYFEFHVPQVNFKNGSGSVRPLTGLFGHDLADGGSWGFNVDHIFFNNYAVVQKGWISFKSGTYLKGLTFTDTATFHCAYPQVGVDILKVRNAANSGNLSVLRMDASNRLVINADANDIYTYAPRMIFNTLGTIATNDANPVQIGYSTKPSNLHVYGSDADVLLLKNSTETTGWKFQVNAANLAFISPTATNPLLLDEAAPNNSITAEATTGDIGIGTASPSARMHILTAGDQTSSMLKLQNSTGTSQFFRSNATPESAITGNQGDLALVSNGNLYLKQTGSGTNTGWVALGSGVTGSGSANQVTYWTGSTTIAGSSNHTWDGTTHGVTGKGLYTVTGTFGANARGFDVAGTMTSSANSVNLEGIRANITFANSGAETGNTYRGIYAPTVTSGSTQGTHVAFQSAPTNSSVNIAALYGMLTTTTESSTSGNLSSRYGGFFSMDKSSNANTTHTGVGLKGRIRDNDAAGRWSTGYGLESEVANCQNAYGVYVGTSNARGTANNAYGLRVGSTVSGAGVTASDVVGVDLFHTESSSGAITNYYGVRSTSTPAADNNYALYFNTATWRAYINGSLAIGSSDINTRTLNVTGEARITDLGTDTPTKIVGADADGDLDTVGIGAEAELHITGGTLGTNFHTTIAPAQLTAGTTNNWNPTGLSTAWIIELSGDNKFEVITGIVAPTFNKTITLYNTGTNSVLFAKEFTTSTAANRFNFELVLFPGKNAQIRYSISQSRWTLVSTADNYRDVEHLYFNESFNAPVSITPGDYDFWNVISETAASLVAPVAGRMKGLSVNTGTSASGKGSVSSKEVFFENDGAAGTATWAYCKAVIRTPAALSDGTNDYSIRVGFNVAVGGAGTTDGYYFQYNHSLVSGNWGTATTNAGNTELNNSGVVVAASTVYVLEVIFRPNAIVEYFINGTRVASNSSFIATGDDMLVMAEIEKSLGTAQRDLITYTLQTSTAFVD